MQIKYDIIIESERGNARVDWGNHKGWIDEFGELLANANRITLVPKDGVELPFVSVLLDEGKRWILFSKVIGQITSVKRVRLYAIGWQSTISGVNVKSITWVYPNGAMENADSPSFWKHYL